MLAKRTVRVKHPARGPVDRGAAEDLRSGAMRGGLRGLARLSVVAGMVIVAIAATRAALGRLAGEPGPVGSTGRRGSFDSWPTVPSAPGRQVPNGSGGGPPG